MSNTEETTLSKTELITEILKSTGHHRSLHPHIVEKINQALDKYDAHHKREVLLEQFKKDRQYLLKRQKYWNGPSGNKPSIALEIHRIIRYVVNNINEVI